MKIIELFLDEDALEGGVDAVSIVDKPAHESNFLTFNTALTEAPDRQFTYIGEMFEKEDQLKLAELVNTMGEPVGTLESQGYRIMSIEPVYSLKEEMEKELLENKFAIQSTPNQPSAEDTPTRRVRYKYVLAPGFSNPIIPTSRTFCKDMLRSNRVFRIEDIIEMTESEANSEFGYYDILTWRGSYNCRHLWVKVVYGKIGPIVGATRPIEEGAPAWAQPSTQVNMSEDLIKNEFGILAMVDGLPLFEDKEDAIKLAEILGCSGYHEYKIEDLVGYMACEEHTFASYDDYPQEASENACKVLRWIDEHGRDEVKGMELTGLARANQLCKREPISEETISRMAAFERHRQNSEISPEFKGTPWKDKGYVAWLGWGGSAGVEWSQRKLASLKEEMDLSKACWPGYEAIGLKDDGSPNCVPKRGMGISISGILNDGGCCYGAEDISIDYDDTLSTERGKELARRLIKSGMNLFIISARNDKQGILKTAKDLGIPASKVFATGSNKAKIAKVLELKVSKHIDNNADVIKELGEIGEQFELIVNAPTYTDEGVSGKTNFASYGFKYDEEKMEITGAAIIPNKMIIRRNPITEELYYVFFSKETTKILSERFMKSGYTTATNLNHTNTPAKNTFITESWIVTNPELDKSNALGLEFPEGTWVITMKVGDDQLWEKIKQGKYNGYSIEGYFNEKLVFN